LGIQKLDAAGGISGVAGAVEDRLWVVLLRFVFHEENDLAADIDVRVVVVVKLRGGDSVADVDEASGCIDVVAECAADCGGAPLLLGAVLAGEA